MAQSTPRFRRSGFSVWMALSRASGTRWNSWPTREFNCAPRMITRCCGGLIGRCTPCSRRSGANERRRVLSQTRYFNGQCPASPGHSSTTHCTLACSTLSAAEASRRPITTRAESVQPGQWRPMFRIAMWVVMDLVESALRTGRKDEAAAHIAAAEETSFAAISPRLALISAGAAAMAADDEKFEAQFELALDIPGADQSPFELARIQLAYGERLRRKNDKAQAREHLRSARSTFDRLGAAPWHPHRTEDNTWCRIAHATTTRDRSPRSGRTHKQGDRRAALPVTPHDQHPPVSAVPKAGRHVACRATRRTSRAFRPNANQPACRRRAPGVLATWPTASAFPSRQYPLSRLACEVGLNGN